MSKHVLKKSRLPATPVVYADNNPAKPPHRYKDVLVPIGPADRCLRDRGIRRKVIRVRDENLVRVGPGSNG